MRVAGYSNFPVLYSKPVLKTDTDDWRRRRLRLELT